MHYPYNIIINMNKILISWKIKKGTVEWHCKISIHHTSAWLLFLVEVDFENGSVRFTTIIFETSKDIYKKKYIIKLYEVVITNLKNNYDSKWSLFSNFEKFSQTMN